MFHSSQKFVVDRPILKLGCIRYTLPSLNLVKREINLFFDIPEKNSAVSLKDIYLELDFNFFHRAGAHACFSDGNHIKLVNLGPFAPFFENRLTNSSGKEREKIDNAHDFCLLYKL